jgi:hypothetical protein
MGYVCMFLGALVLMVGVLAKPVLYENLAKVPLDQKSRTVSTGENMSALKANKEGIEVLTGANLKSTREVIGIPGKAKGNSAFWQTVVVSQAVGVADLTYSSEGVSIDRVTGMATNCCGDFKSVGTIEDPAAIDTKIVHKGLYYKFPFNTQKHTYPWWDVDLGRTEPMKYLRTQDIQGVPTYVFQQKSGPETYSRREGLPGSLFKTDKPVNADAVYQNTRTLYIEPNTGVVIKGVEELDKRLEAPGFAAVPITKGTIGYDAATVSENVKDWGSKGKLLGFVNGPMTLGGILLGLILLVLGGFLTFAGSKAKETATDPQAAADPQPARLE